MPPLFLSRAASTNPRRRQLVGLRRFKLWLGKLWLLSLFGLIWSGAACFAQDAKPSPIARLIPLTSPFGDETLGQVRRTALELQDVATREGRQGYLILEFSPGSSPFHHAYALADFLSEEPFRNVTTIAWIPQTVTGANALPALACQEIVLATNAGLGDLGNGKALSADQQTIIQGIVERRRNTRVTPALAKALSDPTAALFQLTIETADNATESRLATAAEAEQLRNENVVIVESRTISEAGTPTVITGAQARARELLSVRTAESRKELVEVYGLTVDAIKELGAAEAVDKVAYILFHDMIDDVFAAVVERQITRAIKDGAKVLIFEIDSPGGILFYAQDLAYKIAYLSDQHDVRTIAYIPNTAYSAAAILAVACDDIYMHPEAKIGDAVPISLVGQTILRAEEKILSAETELLRTLARLKDRPAALLESFADKDLEVFEARNKQTGRLWYMSADELHQQEAEWTRGPRVPESRSGVALTVDAARAHQLLIAHPPVRDAAELKQRLGLSADFEFRPMGRNWVDTLVFRLNNRFMVGFLLFLAIVCIYIEMATLTGFFGILSAVFFGIFFWSKVMGGTATGLEILLFIVGLGCLALEIFVIPGFGVFGVSGILLVLTSLIMASQTFTGVDLEYDLSNAGKTVGTLLAALAGVAVCAAIISSNLQRIPGARTMVLTSPGPHLDSPDAPRLKPELLSARAALIGQTGQAQTILRPAGKARIDGQLLDVISDGPFIEEGAEVVVVQATPNRIVVREV